MVSIEVRSMTKNECWGSLDFIFRRKMLTVIFDSKIFKKTCFWSRLVQVDQIRAARVNQGR